MNRQMLVNKLCQIKNLSIYGPGQDYFDELPPEPDQIFATHFPISANEVWGEDSGYVNFFQERAEYWIGDKPIKTGTWRQALEFITDNIFQTT